MTPRQGHVGVGIVGIYTASVEGDGGSLEDVLQLWIYMLRSKNLWHFAVNILLGSPRGQRKGEAAASEAMADYILVDLLRNASKDHWLSRFLMVQHVITSKSQTTGPAAEAMAGSFNMRLASNTEQIIANWDMRICLCASFM